MTQLQLDDMTDETQPVNMPGTSEHPNSRRKVWLSLEDIGGDTPIRRIAEIMNDVRGAPTNGTQ